MDIEEALKDPAGAYETPEKLLAHPDLTNDQKRELLRQWKEDAMLLANAENESMAGGERNMLHRVTVALDMISQDDKQ